MDIAEFLAARLAEEAVLAQRLADRYVIPQDAYIVEREPERAGQPFWPSPTAEAAFRNHPDPEIGAGLELVRLYSPARVLAEVAAKRALLKLYIEAQQALAEFLKDAPPPETPANAHSYHRERLKMQQLSQRFTAYEIAVRLAAAPHADHPDYDPAWRVEQMETVADGND